MPQVVKANPSGKMEKRTKLKDVGAGNVFRFAFVSFEQALAGEEGAGFWQVVDTQPKKTGRVTIVSTDCKSLQEKDDDHEVIVHPAKLEVGEAELV